MDGVLREAKAHRCLLSNREAARLKAKKAPGGGDSGGNTELNWKVLS